VKTESGCGASDKDGHTSMCQEWVDSCYANTAARSYRDTVKDIPLSDEELVDVGEADQDDVFTDSHSSAHQQLVSGSRGDRDLPELGKGVGGSISSPKKVVTSVQVICVELVHLQGDLCRASPPTR